MMATLLPAPPVECRLDCLAPLLASEDRCDFPFPALASRQNLSRLYRERARRWLATPTIRVFWKGTEAAAGWSALDWDSRQFRMPAARIEFALAGSQYAPARSALAEVIAPLLNDCRKHGIRHLTARAGACALPLIHTLEAESFEMLDGIQTFGLTLHPASHQVRNQAVDRKTDLTIELFQPWQLDAVVDMAGDAFQFDRFHADPALPAPIADELHREWLRNSCNGSAADAVFVAHHNREVLGFVTVSFDREVERCCQLKLATIVLVATRESARGRGVARATTQFAVEWLKSQDCRAVTVGTQLRNNAAGRLYELCGFRLCGSSLTFRKLL